MRAAEALSGVRPLCATLNAFAPETWSIWAFVIKGYEEAVHPGFLLISRPIWAGSGLVDCAGA